MKKQMGLFVLLLLLIAPVMRIAAQTTSTTTSTPAPIVTIDTSIFPQWAKDIRRGEIIAFGSFPFTMFTATFAMDMYRWADNNGLDWSDAGRRYAPWPLKSAGAIEMTNKEYETTIAIAAGLSLALAITDFIIIQIKRHKAREFAESLPAGTTIITKKPWPPVEDNAAPDETPIPGILDNIE
ncbi:MAG TPA: hypothetical protein DEQ14_12325 [Treponema sp.]|nr:hypothetical protein [Treponema sp.]